MNCGNTKGNKLREKKVNFKLISFIQFTTDRVIY